MADLKSQVEDALNETRILILGAQVLIGAAMRLYFLPVFDRLPRPVIVELTVTLGLMLMGLGLLMFPAAYLLLRAMFFLALGICGDFSMVLHKVSRSYAISGWISGTLLALYFALWFGYSWWKRGQGQQLAISS